MAEHPDSRVGPERDGRVAAAGPPAYDPAPPYGPPPHDPPPYDPPPAVPADTRPADSRPATPPPGEDVPPTAAPGDTRAVPRTRFGGAWIGVTISAVILLLLLVFILENNDTADVAFFGQHGHLPLGVALLLSAVFGVLLVAIPGYGRILQLRRAARHPERLPRHSKRRR
jgi:uncharacterized integral membrane protein